MSEEAELPVKAVDPLVSCVMLTRGRGPFAALAVEQFLRQDYRPAELIVIDDGADPVADLVCRDERVRYIRLGSRMSAGARRNLACEQARGEVIVHWDGAVWHAPHCILYLLDGLLRAKADVCGLNPVLAYDRRSGEAWQVRYPSRARARVDAGSLCYRRGFWERNRFPGLEAGECEAFLRAPRRARIATLPDPGFQVRFADGFKTPRGARRESAGADAVRRLLGSDWPSYVPGAAVEDLAPPARPALKRPRKRPAAAPLVSCILLARDRRRTGLAIEYFLRQDYEPREIIVVDSGAGVEDLLAHDERLRYIRAEAGTSAGAQRNLACEQARGEVIAHWDEGDWQAPHRLRSMVEALGSARAEVCGLNPSLACDVKTGEGRQFWYPVEGKFCGSGGSLCYRRSLWESTRFPDADTGESLRFLWGAHSARMIALADCACQVSMIQAPGADPRRLEGPYWRPYPAADIRRLLGQDWGFYELAIEAPAAPAARTPNLPLDSGIPPAGDPRGFAGRAIEYYVRRDREAGEPIAAGDGVQRVEDPAPAGPVAGLPLVSCVMPTANRRTYVAQAIRYFLRQDYPNKELVILDDGEDGVSDLAPRDPRIRYYRLPGQRTLGAKRNQCVEASRGDLILHWDDDDWMAPRRIRCQVEALLRDGAEVCGLPRLLFHEPDSGRTWLYRYAANDNSWLAGGSLLYTRDFWRRSPFPDMQVGSDTQFIFSQPLQRASFLPDYEIYVAMVHPGNTSRKPCGGPCWEPWTGDLRRIMGGDLDFYMSLARPQAGSGSGDRRRQWLDAVLRRAAEQPRAPGAARESAAGADRLHSLEPRRAPATAPPDDLLDRENWHRWHSRTSDNTSKIPGIGVRAQLAGFLAQLGETLLDLGCGPGALWRHLEPHRGRFSWTGVDLSEETIAAARRMFSKVPACRADAVSLPFPDRSFDVVLLRHVVEFLAVSQVERTLAESARVARKAVVLDFCGPMRAGAADGNPVEGRWSADRIDALLANAGWRLRESFAIAAAREKDELRVFVPGSEE